MPPHKIWPFHALGLEAHAPLEDAHAAHTRLCAPLGASAADRAQRARYDAALAWCVAHWVEGVARPVPHRPALGLVPLRGDRPARVRKVCTPPPSTVAPAIALTALPRPLSDPRRVAALAAYRAARSACATPAFGRVWYA